MRNSTNKRRNHRALLAATLAAAVVATAALADPTTRPREEERLSFQAIEPYRDSINLNADVAMVYDLDVTLPERIRGYIEAGYIPHVMSGVTWGEYAEYYYGDFDGVNHMDEVQMQADGELIGHGKDNYYICPTIPYGNFLIKGVKMAMDAGAEAIHMEEPEYWVRAGYSEGFKREWQDYYGEPWVDPVSSPDAQYRASKLKYYLYRRTLQQIFDFVDEYEKELGRDVKKYVPTHSMLNYAHWGIVSPQSSLLEVGCDGYIAQVWTGTSRTPNVYEGRKRQRTFETAFLEYCSMQNLVRASGRRMWYLNDPIEDNPRHSWWDYRTNWESTLVASLLQPDVWHYEIMPWPHRIFERDYPSTQPVTDETPRVPIPAEYQTELQAVITAMGDMKHPDDRVEWTHAGTDGVGVLVADTMMFQRFGPDASDGDFGSFYGLSLPLLMRGIPVEPVQIETAELDHYNTLVLTYEGQKPPREDFHSQLALWVQGGGALVVVDDDRDPFHEVREWWNTGANDYETPRHHLFETLGLAHDAGGVSRVGDGVVVYADASPAALSHSAGGADQVREWIKQGMAETGTTWDESRAFVLRRGPYVVAAGLGDAEDADVEPTTLSGRFIPLFDPALPEVASYHVAPGTRGLLVDLDRVTYDVGVVASASRARNQVITDDTITLEADGLPGSPAVICLLLPEPPQSVSVDGEILPADAIGHEDGLLRIRFENRAEPRQIVIRRGD